MTDNGLLIFKCLADASRLKILSGLLTGPMYVELIAERLALAPSTVSFHLKKLEAVGLVSAEKDQYYTVYSVRQERLNQPLHALIKPDGGARSVEEQREIAYRRKVIDAFFSYGKLKTIPAQRKKRQIVLREIVEKFDPDTRYPEREVNLTISEVHDDFCTLRRELVVEGLMMRENNVYWRVMGEEEASGDAAP